MSKLSNEEEIRKIVRDEIAVLGLPGGLTALIRACMIVVRWAQKLKAGLREEAE